MTQPAVIYCRVSSLKQVTEGHGLASQETRCREYAKHKGYEVVEVFHDEGITGKLLDRPNMKAMLTYLKQHRATHPVVIIDDISRLARDIETHLRLRASISAAVPIAGWSSICWPLWPRTSARRIPNRCSIA
ncbi:recombinase family protein [Nitrosomonas sp.]|uniref:recombinase family protein n=1 Tax=Nitrosomonas sp. TaxID=42353 RepID=UPI00261B734F|nr:recombinase family protein [Nitrosomonas sp.]